MASESTAATTAAAAAVAVAAAAPFWTITIQFPDGEHLPLRFPDGAQTVLHDIKRLIHTVKGGCEISRQRLVYNGRSLDDDGRPLPYYGIVNNATLILVLR